MSDSPPDTPGVPWLILPTYNEIDNIERIVLAAGAVLAEASSEGYRILVVDDGPPDGTDRSPTAPVAAGRQRPAATATAAPGRHRN